MCTSKETLNDEVYEIHYGCSRFLPLTLEKEPSLCCWRTGTSVRVAGLGVILIKRIFICVLLICMAEAIGEREGRNELGENEWIKLESLGTGYETVMQWCMIRAQVECFMGLCGKRWKRWRCMLIKCVCVCVCVCVCEMEWFLWQYPQMCRDAVMSQRFYPAGELCAYLTHLSVPHQKKKRKKSPKHTK